MRVQELLDKSSVNYKVTEHRPTFTGQQMAAQEHVPGIYVAKPVIVKADDKFYMCVLPACFKIDLDALKTQLGAAKITLAEETEMVKLFPDCALGAEPPFGNLYDLPTIMDQAMEKDDEIVFQAGEHEKAIHMKMADYKKLVQPKILKFSYHTT